MKADIQPHWVPTAPGCAWLALLGRFPRLSVQMIAPILFHVPWRSSVPAPLQMRPLIARRDFIAQLLHSWLQLLAKQVTIAMTLRWLIVLHAQLGPSTPRFVPTAQLHVCRAHLVPIAHNCHQQDSTMPHQELLSKFLNDTASRLSSWLLLQFHFHVDPYSIHAWLVRIVPTAP